MTLDASPALGGGSGTEAPPALEVNPAFRVRNGGWLAVAATCFAGLVPLTFLAASPQAESASNAWIFAYVIAVVIGLRLSWLIAVDPRRIFEIVFWLFTYAFMGLAPLVQIRTDTFPNTTPLLDTSLNATSLAIVAAGSVAFAVGVLIAGNHVAPHPRDFVTRVSPHRVIILSTIALLISTYYVSKLGVGTLFSTREQRSLVEDALWPNATISAVVRAVASLPLVVSFAALMRLRRERRLVGGHGPSVLPWIVAIALFITINPISAPRYVFGTAVLGVAAALGAAATDRRARVLMVSLAIGLVIVFPYADFARTTGQEGPKVTGGPAAALSSADFDAFGQIDNTISYVEVNGHTRGRQITGAALFWVPRAGWPDKPTNTGELLGTFRDYDVLNLSAPIWAELWIDGGWLLLLVGMGGLGWVLRRADERAKKQPRNLRPGVLVGILPFYMIIILRGSMLQAMAGLTVLVLSGLFVRRSQAPV